MSFSLSDLHMADTAGTPQKSKYIMALDSGTTSARAVIVDEYGCIVSQAQRAIPTIYPKSGWVEQDPMEILAAQIAVMMEVQFKSGIHSDRIAAIGISNQRETTIVWDADSGQPIHNAIVWQCRRTAPLADALIKDGYESMIREKTGLKPDAYFSATKISWILDNVDGAREAADAGQLMFGTVDTWLLYNLTGGRVHATDFTNASRTMLFNITSLEWDQELLELLNIPAAMLPDLRWSSGSFGRVSGEIMTHMPPITGVAGDQQASLFGHCCFDEGDVKNTYGTGCFMLMNTGARPVSSKNGLVATIGIAEGGHVSYALEGSIFHAGSVMSWLRDRLELVSSVEESAEIAQSIPDTGGCYVVPAFSGLGAPWWDPDARGLISGLSAASDRATLIRAACESMAYQTLDVLRAMEADAGSAMSELAVDGAAARNEFIMQFQADLLGIPVRRSEFVETTSLGAAYLAGLAVGYWEDREDLRQNIGRGRTFEPSADSERIARLTAGWHDAVARSRTNIHMG
ncbi:glycerol kinase GlpK [Collinsella sp. AGMB00827]|uniref:Glycerol kinase n=1 Tax=Collinsella ureilytica TaxID=2869515 RepID=A0ABS7MJQ3_9ACTN|nr:glycerol kinase GlpK [Collinsella urealyticum]MBY4797594.1 glycerol kinase GlpK [Collinsella urealyticum]